MEERPENYEDKQDVSKGVALKKCPYCKSDIEADSTFCEYCGAKVVDSRPVTPVPPVNPVNSASSTYEERPNNYLGLAIACIIFCWPLGIPSIIKASKVNQLWDKGQYDEARNASSSARSTATTGLIIGIIVNVLYIILIVAEEL